MASPVRFPNGVTNVASTVSMGQLVMPDPTKVITYFTDFHTYAAGDWTVTETQAGATQALSNAYGAGGVMLLTNSAADNDVNQLQLAQEGFKFTAGKKMWFKTRVQVSDATQSDLYFGLIITDTDLVGGITDGVYFRKDDGDAQWDIVSLMNSSGTSSTNIGTCTAATWTTLAFYYDGGTNLEAWIDEAKVATLTVALGTTLVNDEELAVTLSLTNGEAVAKTLAIDYVLAVQER